MQASEDDGAGAEPQAAEGPDDGVDGADHECAPVMNDEDAPSQTAAERRLKDPFNGRSPEDLHRATGTISKAFLVETYGYRMGIIPGAVEMLPRHRPAPSKPRRLREKSTSG